MLPLEMVMPPLLPPSEGTESTPEEAIPLSSCYLPAGPLPSSASPTVIGGGWLQRRGEAETPLDAIARRRALYTARHYVLPGALADPRPAPWLDGLVVRSVVAAAYATRVAPMVLGALGLAGALQAVRL